ncbi:hypothetical protein D3C80_2145610 [compost metagenome]
MAQLTFQRGQRIDQGNAGPGQGRQLTRQLAQLGAAQPLTARLPVTGFVALQLPREQALFAQ